MPRTALARLSKQDKILIRKFDEAFPNVASRYASALAEHRAAPTDDEDPTLEKERPHEKLRRLEQEPSLFDY